MRWMCLALLPFSAWADVALEPLGQGWQVTGEGEVAVFQPGAREVWVVVPGQQALTLPHMVEGWQAERLQVRGGQGVKLVAPAPGTWTVQAQGDGWAVVPGLRREVVATPSALVLRDGVVHGLPVRDSRGVAFEVVPNRGGAWGRDGVAVVQGVVTAAGTSLATVEPAAGQRPVMVAEVAGHKGREDSRKVAVQKGPSLKGVATPVAERAAVVEDLAPMTLAEGEELPADALAVTLANLYVPGTVVPFDLPDGYMLDEGRLRRAGGVAEVERKLAFARAYGAVEDAAVRMQKATEVAGTVGKEAYVAPVPVAPLGEVSVSEVHGGMGAHETEVANDPLADAVDVAEARVATRDEALLPPGGTARGYWFGLKVKLAALNRAMDKAGARIDDGEASGDKVQEETEAAAVEPHAGPDAPVAAPDKGGVMRPVWTRSPAEVAAMPAVVNARRDVVAYYLAWNRPEEAAGEIRLMPTREDGVPEFKEDRLYLAMSEVMRGKGAEAIPLLEADASYMPDHRALWLATALQQVGRSAEALRVWPRGEAVVMEYPSLVRQPLLLTHGEALVTVGQKGDALAFLDNLAAKGLAEDHAAWLNRLRGVVRMGTRKEQEGLELLAQAADDQRDVSNAYRAKFAFVQALLRRGELEDHQVTSYLEDMRLFWRGDELEQQMLMVLGEYYLKQRNYRGALARWKTLAKVYPDMPGMAALTDKMTDAVLGAFDPENPEQYSPLTYLGLYFDFKELLPNDARGDRVMELAGQLLSEQGLPARAIPLLEQVLQYRAKEPIDKARVALLLADAYTANGKPGEALKTLDTYQKMAVNSVQQKRWPLAEARALLALNKPDDAVAALRSSVEREAAWLRADAAWQKQSWGYLADVLAPLVARIGPDDLPGKMANQVAVLRLAYAYGQQGEREHLEDLLARFGAMGEQLPAMADTLAAIATQAGVAEGTRALRPLALVADSLAGLNSFADGFKQAQHQERERRDELEDYNGKMQYMELLPPPAL